MLIKGEAESDDDLEIAPSSDNEPGHKRQQPNKYKKVVDV